LHENLIFDRIVSLGFFNAKMDLKSLKNNKWW